MYVPVSDPSSGTLADVFHIQVGPLPISNLTKAEPLTYYYNKGTSKQLNFRHDNSLRSVWKSQLCESMQDVTLDLLGTVSSLIFL